MCQGSALRLRRRIAFSSKAHPILVADSFVFKMEELFYILCAITTFLIIFPAVTQTRQQDNFFFDPSPRDRDVIQGQGTLLRCDVSNRKHIRFYWTLNNRKVQNDSRRYQEDSDLRITRVSREEDKGVFNCIAVNVTTGVSIQSTGAALNMLCEYYASFNPNKVVGLPDRLAW